MSGDVFSVISDASDPTGSGLRGHAPGFNLTRTTLAKPIIQWRDFFITADVYVEPDHGHGSGPLSVHLYCPMCAMRAAAGSPKHNALMIRQQHKKIDLDLHREPRFAGIHNADLLTKMRLSDRLPILDRDTPAWRAAYREAFASISIETFQCSWEGEYGICSWRVAVEHNVARDV